MTDLLDGTMKVNCVELREMEETVAVSPSILHHAGANQQEGRSMNMARAHSYRGTAQLVLLAAHLSLLLIWNSAMLSRNASGHTLMPDNITKGFLN